MFLKLKLSMLGLNRSQDYMLALELKKGLCSDLDFDKIVFELFTAILIYRVPYIFQLKFYICSIPSGIEIQKHTDMNKNTDTGEH